MIAIGGEPDIKIDFEQLFAGVKEKLPSYARPYFIRIVSETDMTGKSWIKGWISHFFENIKIGLDFSK